MPEAAKLFRADELASRLGIPKKTVLRWGREGRLGPTIKIAHTRWFLQEAVEKALRPQIAPDADATALTSMQ